MKLDWVYEDRKSSAFELPANHCPLYKRRGELSSRMVVNVGIFARKKEIRRDRKCRSTCSRAVLDLASGELDNDKVREKVVPLA